MRGKGGGNSHQRGCIFSPAGRLYGFRRQRRYKKWRRRRRTSPAGTVSQPIGKPFNGQAKGLLWLTWRSYAGPPQYFIPPEGGALNLSGRRQPVPDRTLGAQGQRPGGAINPRGEAASTFGNTGKRRDPKECRHFLHAAYVIIITIHKAKERRKTWVLLMC